MRGALIQKQLLLPDLGDCYECLRLAGFAPKCNTEQGTCTFEAAQRAGTDDRRKFREQKLPRLDAKAAFGPTRLRRDFIRQGISFCFEAGAAEPDSPVPQVDHQVAAAVVRQEAIIASKQPGAPFVPSVIAPLTIP